MPGELSGSEELLAAVLLVAQVGAVLVVSVLVTLRLVGPDWLARALVALLLALGLATTVPLTLGMVGLLGLPAVLAVEAGAAAVAIALHRRHPLDGQQAVAVKPLRPLGLAAIGANALYFALGTKLSLHPSRSYEFDTKEYHLANLASWLQEGHIWDLPYTPPGSMTANHPSSGEMFGLWLTLPSHGDEVLYFAPLAFALLAVLAGAVLGREVSEHEDGAALGALGALAVVSAPIYFAQIHTLMTDLISAAAVVAAVALLVLARRTPQRSGALVAMAGVGLGLGIGSKYTALLPGLVVGFGAIFLLRRSRAWWWLAPGVLLLAAPWYLRNLLTTGNPLFPQAIGPLDGGQSPIDLLESSLFDQLVDGETGILRRVADLAQDFLGPVLLIAAVGVLGPFLRRGDASGRQIARWLGGLAAAGLLLYALTPYTGGGPTGLAFIIASCFRYALIGMLLAGIVGVAVAGRRAGTMLALAVLGWNLSKAVRDAGVERTQLHLTARALAGGLVAAVLTMLVVHVLTVWPELRRRVPAAVVSVVALIGAVGATTAAFHRLDRGRTPSPLESMLLAYGEDEPAVVLGVADLRAVLGPRLERRMVKVARGGEAGEVPFADEAQFRRRVLGEDTPRPPRHLGRELDAALDEAGTVLLVTGPVSPVAFPDGWRPDDSWCFAGADVEGVVFVRRAAMLPGVECVTADQL